jgi:hypothetical protein
MLFSFVRRFPDHRPKRIIGNWHATMFAASRIDESAPASEVPNFPPVPANRGSQKQVAQKTSNGPIDLKENATLIPNQIGESQRNLLSLVREDRQPASDQDGEHHEPQLID